MHGGGEGIKPWTIFFMSYDPYQGKLLRVVGLAVGKKYGNSQNKQTTIGANIPTYMKSMIHCQVTYMR